MSLTYEPSLETLHISAKSFGGLPPSAKGTPYKVLKTFVLKMTRAQNHLLMRDDFPQSGLQGYLDHKKQRPPRTLQ